MGEYDITLRYVTRIGGRSFLRAMGVEGRLTPIHTDFPNTRSRQVDFLAALERPDGSKTLLHIEFQSAPDPSMAARMLGYYSDILIWLAERKAAGDVEVPQELLQKIVYVGARPWSPATRIEQPGLQFRFEVVNAMALPARPLLQSGDLGDAVVAVLCADGTDPDVVKAILARIAGAPENQRSDALAQLMALSGLRGLRPVIEREYKAMGIIVNVEDTPLLREPIDRARTKALAEGLAKGRAQGEALAIERILRTRFPTQVPDGLADHLADIVPAALEDILQRSVTAVSVEEALGTHMPTKVPGLGG
jgi:hypothetical protein